MSAVANQCICARHSGSVWCCCCQPVVPQACLCRCAAHVVATVVGSAVYIRAGVPERFLCQLSAHALSWGRTCTALGQQIRPHHVALSMHHLACLHAPIGGFARAVGNCLHQLFTTMSPQNALHELIHIPARRGLSLNGGGWLQSQGVLKLDLQGSVIPAARSSHQL